MSNGEPHREPIVTHPVAPRLVPGGTHTPHVGPDLAAYKAAHADTVGEGSDEWWAKVCYDLVPISGYSCI
jgi:acetyl-CoA synthetase